MSTPVVVLGMHRSGTSALAGALRRLGAWLGSDEHVTRRNEHQGIQDCNQAILDALGGHWSAPPSLAPGWTERPVLAPLAPAADRALDDLRSQRDGVFAWKDPRSCFTLPYWRARLDDAPVVVVSYRHPVEVGDSLAARNAFAPGHAHALWEAYNRALLEHAAGLRAVVVAYRDLAEQPAVALAALVARLADFGLRLPGALDDAVAAVEPGRRHHVHDDHDGLPATTVTPQQAALWHALSALPAASERFAPPSLEPPHVASTELLAQRASTIRVERERDEWARALRSRRELLRRLTRRR